MKVRIFFSLIFLATLIGSCNSDKYSPSKFIDESRERIIIDSIIRYAAKLPPNASHKTKFDTSFDSYYNVVAAEYRIGAYFIGKDSTNYILFTRPARSVTPMKEAIGCKINFDSNGRISDYEEVFRTWKMPEGNLIQRFPILFEKMVKGESLEPYYSKNKGDQYIEFPDDRFYFDKEERKWKDNVFDSIRISP
jgi:hypothetical protein